MKITLKAHVDLEVFERMAKECPAILENTPTLQILAITADRGMGITFDTPQEFIEYLRIRVSAKKSDCGGLVDKSLEEAPK